MYVCMYVCMYVRTKYVQYIHLVVNYIILGRNLSGVVIIYFLSKLPGQLGR